MCLSCNTRFEIRPFALFPAKYISSQDELFSLLTLLIGPFLLMSPFNVLFYKEVTENVHENQQAKSRAS